MADKEVSSLPKALTVTEDTLFPAYVPGSTTPAQAVTGEQFAAFARESVENATTRAETAATEAESAAERSEAARYSIVVDQNLLSQAVHNAESSAISALSSEQNAASSESSAEEWANKAQAEADRATLPPVAHVYQIILMDRVTEKRYSLIIENGRLVIMEVSSELDPTQSLIAIDNATGIAYKIGVESGRLYIEET